MHIVIFLLAIASACTIARCGDNIDQTPHYVDLTTHAYRHATTMNELHAQQASAAQSRNPLKNHAKVHALQRQKEQHSGAFAHSFTRVALDKSIDESAHPPHPMHEPMKQARVEALGAPKHLLDRHADKKSLQDEHRWSSLAVQQYASKLQEHSRH